MNQTPTPQWQLDEQTAFRSSDPSELAQLAHSDDRHVRYEVARNYWASEATLDLLSTDEDVDVRYEVAHSDSTAIATLEEMARRACSDDHDEVGDVVDALVENLSTPDAAILLLAKDGWPKAMTEALARGGCPITWDEVREEYAAEYGDDNPTDCTLVRYVRREYPEVNPDWLDG